MKIDTKAWRKGEYEGFSLEFVGNHIVIIYIDNPPVNAINFDPMVLNLDEIWRCIREDDDIRCSIITGKDTEYKGKHYFCSGADVKEWSGTDTGKVERYTPIRPMILPRGAYETEACYNSSKPSISMVNGTAVGVGADWALVTDITIASEDARIGWVYILRGLAPVEGGTWLLPRRIGVNRAIELLTTGEIIDAQEAYRLGIFNKVVPHNQLRDTVLKYARYYAEEGAPLAIGATRSLVYHGLQQSFRDHMESVGLALGNVGPDRKEAMAAWIEKREPHFEGKGVSR